MIAEFFRASTVASSYAGLSILCLTLGYWIGVGSSLPITRGSDSESGEETSPPEKEKNSDDEDDDDGDAAADGDLRTVQASGLEECKLVRVTFIAP